MDYAALKLLHQVTVGLSLTGFALRGALSLAGSPLARTRLARTLPHVVDSVLLASAIGMLWMLRANPLQVPWLAVKLAGLLAYIGLGMLALRPGRPVALRAAAWVGALLVVGWMVSVALTKQPAGWWG